MKLLPDVNVVRLKGVEKQLDRIANALEEIVLREYGIPLRATPKPKEDESDVLYTNDEELFVKELKDLANYQKPDRPIDVDDEDLR